MHQAVCVTFDPALEIEGCSTWQLLRPTQGQWQSQQTAAAQNNGAESTPAYTIDKSKSIVEQQGFILVAMNSDGTCFRRKGDAEDDHTNNKRLMYCLAPTVSEKVLSKPISKNSVSLAPFTAALSAQEHQQQLLLYYVWQVERFPGGGLALSTHLETVRAWLVSKTAVSTADSQPLLEAIKSVAITDASRHYVTDDLRLYSSTLSEGQGVGFGMRIAFPPIVDVTALLDRPEEQSLGEGENVEHDVVAAAAASASSQVKTVARNLVDAAVDCGFFFAVMQHDDDAAAAGFDLVAPPAPSSSSSSSSSQTTTAVVDNNAFFVTAGDAHAASERLLDAVRRSFGRCLGSSPPDAVADVATTATVAVAEEDVSIFEPLKPQLTKVTLKSTTGIVKTEFNPPRFAPIELPAWLRHLGGIDARVYSKFVEEHGTFCQSVDSSPSSPLAALSTSSVSSTSSDLVRYFHFGEELASRMVALLLLGVAPSMTAWPSEADRAQHRELRGIEPTHISFRRRRCGGGGEGNLLIPRVEPAQFYSLFRAVCYPPSRRGFPSSPSSSSSSANDGKGEKMEKDGDDEENSNSRDGERSSSHKSDDTDDSEGKALYEHTDKTHITLLVAAPSLSGLQVVDADGSTFTDVKLPANLLMDKSSTARASTASNNAAKQKKGVMTFICNIGDALQMISRGAYISRTHRARNPAAAASSSSSSKDECIHEKEQGMSDGDDDDDEKNRRPCLCAACRVSLPLFVEPSPQRWPVAYECGSENVRLVSL